VTLDSCPTQDSRLVTLDSPSTQDSPANLQPDRAALADFEEKYKFIDHGFIFGAPSRFTEAIRDIMDETLTPAKAIEEMRHAGRQSQWNHAERIEKCIADYATLHPRLVGYAIPPLPPPLGALERYYRPQPQPPQPHGDGPAHPIPGSQKSRERRGS
jgi:hypothetical protein